MLLASGEIELDYRVERLVLASSKSHHDDTQLTFVCLSVCLLVGCYRVER